MKKIVSLLFVTLVVVSLVAAVLPQGAARSAALGADRKELYRQQSQATPTSSQPEASSANTAPGNFSTPNPEDIASFRMFGLSEKTMHGPYDSYRIRFSLPATWQLEDGAELVLIITAFVVKEDQGDIPLYTGGLIAGSLDITYNKQLIGSLALKNGQNVEYRIPIPAETLISARENLRHDLFFFLDAGVDCELANRRTTIVIEPDSAFIFPHTLNSPTTDLTRLPRPFYQTGAFLIDPAVIVLPEKPSANELQAALTTAAGFGRMTNGKLPVSLITEKELTQEARERSNLIFVGKAASLPSLVPVELPATISETGFSAPGVQVDDGVIQLALSPWDPSKVVLVLGGGSDTGVIKAAQAFSSASFQTAATPDLAVVSEVRPDESLTSVPVDRSFTDLNYSIQSITGAGNGEIFYNFFIPPGQVPTQEAYLDLVHSHSDVLDVARSGVVVSLNGQPIGNILLEGDNTGQARKRISIPASALVPGENTISILADLLAFNNCSVFIGDNLWITVFPESSLHIPLGPAKVILSALKDLADYPYPFLSNPTLGNLAFILPQDGLYAWQAAVQVAFDLGNRSNGILYEPAAAYADQIPEEILKNRDLILVGVPDQLPILTELNKSLPVPFEAGTNQPTNTGGRVVYRLPEGASVGYLELLPSTWDPVHSILAVLASKPEALRLSIDALTVPAMRSQLCGDFAAIQGSQVTCRDSGLIPDVSTLLVSPTQAAQAEITSTTTPIAGLLSSEDMQSSPPENKLGWIMPAIAGLAVLMAVVAGIALFVGPAGEIGYALNNPFIVT